MSTWKITQKLNKDKVLTTCTECGFTRIRSAKHAHEGNCISCKKQQAILKLKFIVKKAGYKLNENSYVNSRSTLQISCPQGHTFESRADNVLAGSFSCPKCRE